MAAGGDALVRFVGQDRPAIQVHQEHPVAETREDRGQRRALGIEPDALDVEVRDGLLKVSGALRHVVIGGASLLAGHLEDPALER